MIGPEEIAGMLSSTDLLTAFPIGGLPKEAEILIAILLHQERAAALFWVGVGRRAELSPSSSVQTCDIDTE